MATAQLQQVVAAPAHDNSCVKEEEKNHQIIDGTPCAEVKEPASHAKVHDDNGGCTDEEGKGELEVAATDTDTDEGQRIAQEVEAKLAIQNGPAEAEAEDTKEGRPGRGAKKTDKAAAKAKGAIVPVDDDDVAGPEEPKAAVVPVDDHETDDEVVAPAGQAPAAAPIAPEEAAGEDVTKGVKQDACQEKAHDE